MSFGSSRAMLLIQKSELDCAINKQSLFKVALALAEKGTNGY
jgi:hypothetical protein